MHFNAFQLPKWGLKNSRAIATSEENKIKNIDVPSNADVIIIGKYVYKKQDKESC